MNELAALSRIGISVAFVAATILLLSTLLVLAPGRGGLPADELTEALRFTGAAVDDDSAARVLLIGPGESLPGTSRTVRGASYRVVSSPVPQLWEAELPAPGPADRALQQVVEDAIDAGSFRVGEQLAQFGIRWVVAMDSTPLSSRFEGQLDLIPLDGLRRTSFLVDSPNAVTALSADGTAWSRDGVGFVGEAADTVLVREQSHPGWGQDLVSGDWAMTLDASAGSVDFTAGEDRRAGLVSLWSGAGLAVLSVLLRRRR